jgi:hypothetical protein
MHCSIGDVSCRYKDYLLIISVVVWRELRGCASSRILVNIPISRHMCRVIVWSCVVAHYSPYRAIADFSNFCDAALQSSDHLDVVSAYCNPLRQAKPEAPQSTVG